MPPYSSAETKPEKLSSFPHLKYPSLRDTRFHLGDEWLEGKRIDDDCEGLWRVHNDLYDLSNFIKIHPGGQEWLKMTKGTDITEAFEAHHISTTAEQLLPKFHIRKATTLRNSPFTFKDDGFYRTLKRKVRQLHKTLPTEPARKSKLLLDTFMLGYILTAILAAKFENYFLIILSGILLCANTIGAHNFFHQRDNFRMYYFDLSTLSSREWRITHVLSHHLYTNTLLDIEISALEPLLMYLPRTKTVREKYLTWLYSPLYYIFFFPIGFLSTKIARIFDTKSIKHLGWPDFLFLIPSILMYLLSGSSLFVVIKTWLLIYLTGSFIFELIGLNAAHHHPDIFHDGDKPREDRDWGLGQIDALMDRKEIQGHPFITLITFGDHCLHHIFPTLDHGVLPYLYPVFNETCKQFGVELRTLPILSMMKGQFLQLTRTQPNPVPPASKKSE